MDELNPTVREQEIYEEMELTPEMIKSIRTLCATCLRHFVEAKAFKIALVPSADKSMEEIRFPHLHGLQRQRSQGRSADEVLKHILSAKGHLQAADVPCYILKITIYRSDDTMVDKFSQVAGNVPVTNNDPNRRYTVINGYPVVLNFAKEPNPGVFERVRDILLATSYTKKTS